MANIDPGYRAGMFQNFEALVGDAAADYGQGLDHPDSGRSRSPDVHSSTPDYAARFAGPVGDWFLDVQARALLDLMAPWRGGVRVLDVGGGHGQSARTLLGAGHEVTVLSSTEAAWGEALRERGRHGDRLRFATGRLDALPYADGAFDVVVSLRTMAHVEDWRAFVAELSRVARQGVIVDFPIPGGVNLLEPLLFGAKKRLEGNTRRFTTIARDDARAAFAGAGLDADAATGQFVLPMAVHRALKHPGLSKALEAPLAPVSGRIGSPVLMRARRR